MFFFWLIVGIILTIAAIASYSYKTIKKRYKLHLKCNSSKVCTENFTNYQARETADFSSQFPANQLMIASLFEESVFSPMPFT